MSNYEHAIVIGGSMAGLLAARALSDHFQRVTIIERDSLPTEADARAGVPQGRHLHVLLAKGQQVLDRLFPGLSADLDAAGVPTLDIGTQYGGLTSGGWLKPFGAGRLTSRTPSRPTLEHLVRQRLLRNPAISILERTDVDGLLTDDGKQRIVGVQVTSRADHRSDALHADMVVDCSGRNSKGPEWLAALGHDAPHETMVNSNVSYATRVYEANPTAAWTAITVAGRPTENLKRGGGIILAEGGRWIVTLVGVNGDVPPNDEAGFLAFAKSLATPVLYEVIKDARPLTAITGFRYQGSRIRHYERLTRRPERLLLMGDAVCSFNPIYGQGMTVAALEADLLGTLLTARAGKPLDGLATAFQRALPRCTRDAWLMATGEDLRYPETVGERPNGLMRMVQVYMDWALAATASDAGVAETFARVAQLLDAPSVLFRPQVMLAVLRNRFFNRPQAQTAPEMFLAAR
jgi:2-polyprenyl-6-methoxyphenol hydroxylase-like FAD-dependent oxidoreductase